MSPLFADSTITLAFWVVVKASAVLAVAAGVQIVWLRGASAASRHLVWTLAVWSVLLLPAAALALPAWEVVIRTAPASRAVTPVGDAVHAESSIAVDVGTRAGAVERGRELPQPSPFSTADVIAIVYAAGVLMTLLYLGIQHWSVRRLARYATAVDDASWIELVGECARRIGVHRTVRVLRSRERLVPAAFGTRRPSIVLPSTADTWPDDRRRAVLMHELAHVARLDCLTQLVTSVACAIYWFHPVVWWIDRRMRAERELACDDRVIGAGAEGRDYAGHLLEIAYSLGGDRAPSLAVSMARPRQLEGRMLAALDRTRNRTIPTTSVRIAAAAIAVAVLCPLAVAAPLFVDVDTMDAAVTGTGQAAPPQPSRPAIARLVRAGATSQSVGADAPAGTWELRPTSTSGIVYLQISEGHSQSGTNVPVETLEGLNAAQLTGAAGPVTFRLRRDAGTFAFEGVVRQGVGAGTVSFSPDAQFPVELARRGYAKPSEREQYELARYDIGYRFLDELKTQGYSKADTPGLVRAGQHGVNTAYLSDMGALGYRLGALDALITLKDHGVDPAYVRQLADLGYKGLSADDLRRARDHGITPEYVRGMREAGYGSLPMEELVTARDHGVTVEFVQALSEAGHGKVPLEQLVRVRDHGVSPDYVRDMRQLGYALGLDDLVRARDHGVSSEFVRKMADLGYKTSAIDALIRLRDHGVTPEYVQEVKALGYDRLSIDDLVRLRDHGLSAERIRQANSSAGSRLSVDQLQAVAEGRTR